jgi:hypothetical protein
LFKVRAEDYSGRFSSFSTVTVSTTWPSVAIVNPGFESNSATQTPTGWSESSTASASYTEAGGRTGSYSLIHWASTSFKASTYQTLSVPNGTYVLGAYYKSGGGDIKMIARDFGGTAKNISLGTSTFTWTQKRIEGIEVTNGSLTIEFLSDHSSTSGGGYLAIDDVTLSRTDLGSATDRTDPAPAAGIIAARGQYKEAEGAPKAFDNNFTTSKWLDLASATWIQYTFPSSGAYAVERYVITSGNDVPDRDPKSWILWGTNVSNSMDLSQYTKVHQVDDFAGFTERNMKVSFIPTTKNTAYKTYRLQIVSNKNGGAATQINELQLFAPTTPPSVNVVSNNGEELKLNQGTTANNITVFPNPVTYGWITIGLSAADKDNMVDVSLSDLSGRIVYKNKFTSNGISERLNIDGVQPGIYVIRVSGTNTKFNSKIIVE